MQPSSGSTNTHYEHSKQKCWTVTPDKSMVQPKETMVQMIEMRIFFRGVFVTFLAYYWSRPHSRLIGRCVSSAPIGQTQHVHVRRSNCRDRCTKLPRKNNRFSIICTIVLTCLIVGSMLTRCSYGANDGKAVNFRGTFVHLSRQ